MEQYIERLRDMLDEARLQIEYLHNKFQKTGTGETVIAQINALLQEPVSAPSYSAPSPDIVNVVTAAMREADPIYQTVGGGTRHYVRDLLLPILSRNGYVVTPAAPGQIAGVQWVKASDRLPSPFKVVPCKYTPDSPDPRTDTELHWGFVSKDGAWNRGWQNHKVEWLDESSSSLSTPSDCKEVTGHNSIEEYRAYEEGYSAREKVTIEWIKKWDGSTNSGFGKLLMDKFQELATSISTAKGPAASEEFIHCNHHHELTENHQLVDFGDGEFVANKAAIPLLKALNEVGLRTRSHHIDKLGEGFVCILMDNLDVEYREVNERDATRTKYNGKKEVLLCWGPHADGRFEVKGVGKEQETAIAFAEWLERNRFCLGTAKWESAKKLYALFLQSQTKQQ